MDDASGKSHGVALTVVLPVVLAVSIFVLGTIIAFWYFGSWTTSLPMPQSEGEGTMDTPDLVDVDTNNLAAGDVRLQDIQVRCLGLSSRSTLNSKIPSQPLAVRVALSLTDVAGNASERNALSVEGTSVEVVTNVAMPTFQNI